MGVRFRFRTRALTGRSAPRSWSTSRIWKPRLLMRRHFDLIFMQKTTGSLEALAQTMSVYVVNNLSLPIRGWGGVMSLFICCPIQICGLLLQRLLPDQRKLFLDCVIIARREV